MVAVLDVLNSREKAALLWMLVVNNAGGRWALYGNALSALEDEPAAWDTVSGMRSCIDNPEGVEPTNNAGARGDGTLSVA